MFENERVEENDRVDCQGCESLLVMPPLCWLPRDRKEITQDGYDDTDNDDDDVNYDDDGNDDRYL